MSENKKYNETDRLLDAIGALAEQVKFFYDCLTSKGFNEEQSMRLCVCYLSSLIGRRDEKVK